MLDYALQEATRDTSISFMSGSRKPAIFITEADFADNLALLSNYMEQSCTEIGNFRRNHSAGNQLQEHGMYDFTQL